jgi:hypothetical protein
MLSKTEKEQAMTRQQKLRSVLPALLLGFLIGSYNGRLAVWKTDDPEPYRVYPCPVYLLPKRERAALMRGIRIDSMEDVADFLENFLS